MPTDTKSGLSDGFLLHQHDDYLRLMLPAPLANRLDYEFEAHEIHLAAELELRKEAPPEAERQLQDAITVETHTLSDECANRGATHQVYTYDELDKLGARISQVADTDQKEILRRLHAAFRKRGVRRAVAMPHQMKSLDVLAASCPNFSEVVGIVRDELQAAEMAQRPPQLPALLLLGEAGLGKTHFCQLLADALGLPQHKLGFDSSITSSALCGVDPQWGTAKAGLLLDAICSGEFANPVILLDEIDKCVRSRSDDPLAPLHTLLERSTAARFRDIFANFEFDTSLVTWIATANDASDLPATLRSRFTEILIQPPTAAQAITQAIAIAREVVNVLAPDGFEQPGSRICVSLAHLTPREIKTALSAALRRAVANGRIRLERRDFPLGVFDEECESEAAWLH
jgi:ATP-dependent Lon protease